MQRRRIELVLDALEMIEPLDRVADLVVPFRRDVYRTVAQSFSKFAG